MKIIADLHIHSRFSRATSKGINIENLEKYARIKGLQILGTGDFTHPLWFKEIRKLKEEDGILKTKTGFSFILQTEISLMYAQDGKQRRVHLVVLAPNFWIVEQINSELSKYGKLDYDGRPIFGLNCPEFLEIMTKISRDIEVIPAHCLTPWFGIFGSKSGFNSLKEAFQEKSNKIHALETGLSADPEMIWRIPNARDLCLVSNSDLHSFWPWRLGREAIIFDFKKLNYKNIIKAIRENEIKATIEVDPSYGKYHFDGHRSCNFSCSPQQALKLNNICPICHKPLTIGVEHRVEELADKPKGFKPKNAKPFFKLLPLHELIAKLKGSSINSKIVWKIYNDLIEKFNNEFRILLDISEEEIARYNEKLAKYILLNRKGKIKIKPGFDGVYGKIELESEQKTLF